jgi:hypothetical protein
MSGGGGGGGHTHHISGAANRTLGPLMEVFWVCNGLGRF